MDVKSIVARHIEYWKVMRSRAATRVSIKSDSDRRDCTNRTEIGLLFTQKVAGLSQIVVNVTRCSAARNYIPYFLNGSVPETIDARAFMEKLVCLMNDLENKSIQARISVAPPNRWFTWLDDNHLIASNIDSKQPISDGHTIPRQPILERRMNLSEWIIAHETDSVLADKGLRIGVCIGFVSNSICVDLLDYLHRDWYRVAKERGFDGRFSQFMERKTSQENEVVSKLPALTNGRGLIDFDSLKEEPDGKWEMVIRIGLELVRRELHEHALIVTDEVFEGRYADRDQRLCGDGGVRVWDVLTGQHLYRNPVRCYELFHSEIFEACEEDSFLFTMDRFIKRHRDGFSPQCLHELQICLAEELNNALRWVKQQCPSSDGPRSSCKPQNNNKPSIELRTVSQDTTVLLLRHVLNSASAEKRFQACQSPVKPNSFDDCRQLPEKNVACAQAASGVLAESYCIDAPISRIEGSIPSAMGNNAMDIEPAAKRESELCFDWNKGKHVAFGTFVFAFLLEKALQALFRFGNRDLNDSDFVTWELLQYLERNSLNTLALRRQMLAQRATSNYVGTDTKLGDLLLLLKRAKALDMLESVSKDLSLIGVVGLSYWLNQTASKERKTASQLGDGVLHRSGYLYGTAFNAVFLSGVLSGTRASGTGETRRTLSKVAEAIACSRGIAVVVEDSPETPACAITVGKETVIYVHNRFCDRQTAFLILHELGHLELRHNAFSEVGLVLKSATTAQYKMFTAQEREADLFAEMCLSILSSRCAVTARGDASPAFKIRSQTPKPVPAVASFPLEDIEQSQTEVNFAMEKSNASPLTEETEMGMPMR